MKVVILAGGFGTRISEESHLKPKPMIEIGERPVPYKHSGFWQPMDTLRDKNFLEELWQSGEAPWKIWNNGNW